MANKVTWTSAQGDEIDLTDEGAGFIVTPGGTKGLTSVSYEMSADEYAGVDGAVVRTIRAVPNEPSLGLQIRADGEQALRRKLRGLVHQMLPQAGLGRLSIHTPWGEVRSLECFVTDGLQGDEDLSVTQPGRWFRTILKFYAPNPWWIGEEQFIDVGLGTLPEFFPFFLLTLAPSTVQGEFEVNLHDTDAKAYPLWTIHGPGSNLVLANASTGRSIEVETTLLEGEKLIIDTRPGRQSVRRFTVGMDPETDVGINEMAALKTDPALWPLEVQSNRIVAQLTGATPASRVTGVYTPRYAGF